MSRYTNSTERQHLSAIQARARVLASRFDQTAGDLPLPVILPMIDQINTVMRQLGYLKSQLETAAYAEMTHDKISEVETPEWTAAITAEDKITGTDHIAVASALREQIIAKEVRRNKRVPERAITSIVDAAFWGLFESLNTPKWKKTILARKGIKLEDHSKVTQGQAKVRVEKKQQD